MTMFRALAPALTIWAANPRGLRVVLLDKVGQPQDLTGRTAALAIRRSSMLEPRVTVEAVLSTDGYAWLLLLTAEQCDLIYADGQAYGLSYDVIETYAGGSLRWTGRIDAQPASNLPGDAAAPVLLDLPVAELVSETDTILISERGARGPALDQWLKDMGDIPEATPQLARDKIRQWGGEGAAPFVTQAEEARDLAQEAEEGARQHEEQTQLDRYQTGQDVLATQTALAQTLSAAQIAAAVANIKSSIPHGEATTAEGGYFTIEGSGVNFVELYQVVNGVAVYRDVLPNGAALDSAVAAVAYQITQRAQLPAADGMEPVLSDDVIWSIPGETSGPATTRSGDFYARQPHSIGAPVLTDYWLHVELADQNGVPLVAVHPEGFVYTQDTVPFLSDTYRYAVVSDDYAVLSSVLVDGGSADPSKSWYAIERDGHILLSTQDGLLIRMTDQAGDLTPPQIIGSELIWTDFSSGAGIITRLPLGDATGFASSIDAVEHIIASGQSLSRGIPLTPVTIGTPDPGRLMMFSQGVNASAITPLTAADFSNLTSASVSVSEVPVLSAGRQYLRDKALATGAIVSGHGYSGYSYTQLRKGTIPYSNMITAMQTTARQCTRAGLPYRVPFHSWIQGEADTGVAKGVYLGWLVEHQGNVTTDYQAVVSTTDQVVLVSSQPSNFTAYSQSLATAMVLEHLEASLLYPTKFICTGPKYDLTYNDNTHPTSAGFLHMGEMDGRAMRLFRAGLWKGPLYAKTAARTGATVVLTFNAPHGGAAIDFFTGIVSDPGNYGITFHQTGGNAVNVASVAITGDFEITVTLSSIPTGTAQRIGIAATGTPGQWAGPTTGGRSCIRSAIAETDAQARALDHYACHQFIDIA